MDSGDGGRWRDGVRVRAWVFAVVLDNGGTTKRIEWCSTVLTFEFTNFHFFDFDFFLIKKNQ